MNDCIAVVNATEYPPRLKHKTIFDTYHALEPGQAMLLINDHDPLPLYYQFQAEYTGQFTWEYLERGPENFRVRIGKVLPTADGQ